MVANISEVAAKAGNVKVCKWALCDVAENGHMKILELADSKEDLDWYSRDILEGYVEVVDWWKSVELIELTKEAAYSGQWRMLDNLYENEYQEACSDLKEFLNGSIVNCAASGGQIEAL
jgi:hypothetical protein